MPTSLVISPSANAVAYLPETTCSLNTTSELKLRAVEALKTPIIVAGVSP